MPKRKADRLEPPPVADSILRLRSALGYSRPALARRIGTSIGSIINYERADRHPPAQTLEDLRRLAANHQLEDLERVFEAALRREAHARGSHRPITEEETIWVRVLLTRLRYRALSASDVESAKKELEGILTKLAEGHEAECEEIHQLLGDFELVTAETAEDKVDLLVERRMAESGLSRDQAFAAVLNENPALFAGMLEEFHQSTAAGEILESKVKLRELLSVKSPKRSAMAKTSKRTGPEGVK